MKKQLVLSTLFSLLVMVAMAQPQGHGKTNGKGMKGNHHEMMMKSLNLSTDQQTQINIIHKKTKRSSLDTKNQLGEKEARMKTLTSSDNADTKAITKLAGEISALKAQMYLAHVLAKVEIRSLLNEDQKLQFDSMKHGKSGKGMSGPH